jgi:hypothetical protein
MKRILVVLLLVSGAVVADEPWDQASANGEQARVAFLKCWRFVHGWLQHTDPATGLIPRNLRKDAFWNARDCAADNYPFMVLTTFFTDRALFEGRMKEILATEQRLCNRVGQLPDDWLFETQQFRVPEIQMDALIFGASEYAKDGLMPLTEWLGPSPWSERMVGLLDAMWEHADIETEVGKVPANSHEVCGNLMQTLSRMYWMTGKEAYREQAYRLADYYLLYHSPVQVDRLQLDDHGCEVIGGLSEVYFLAAHKHPEKREQWQPAMHAILDRILEVGRDENGLLISVVNPITGEKLTEDKTDNWGYNYNAFLVVADLDNAPRFREAVQFVLGNLLKVKDYKWEGGSSDGYADSLEGGLNLINRLPVPEAIEWADYVARILLDKPRDTGVIEGWHGDGNFARTALMYALWKTQGAYVEPWRADVRIGAAAGEDGRTYWVVEADWPWRGLLRFDIPRHAEYLHLPSDYPRLNQFPEWFTVPEDCVFESEAGDIAAEELRRGLPVSVSPDKPYRLWLNRKPAP